MTTRQDTENEKKVFDTLSAKNLKTRKDSETYRKLYAEAGITKTTQPNKLLEIGCGEGIHCFGFSKLGYQCTGIDISPTAIETAKREFEGIDFFEMTAQKLDFEDQSFDTVVFWATLHHFYYADEDMSMVLEEANRVLKKDGTIYIVEPNRLYLYNFLAYTGAHYLNKIINIPYLKRVYTSNEGALNPHKILPGVGDKKLIYFDWLINVVDDKSHPVRLLARIRNLLDKVAKLLPERFKYDFFSLKIDYRDYPLQNGRVVRE